MCSKQNPNFIIMIYIFKEPKSESKPLYIIFMKSESEVKKF